MDERRSHRDDPPGGPRSKTITDARMSLALWLRAGRAERGMSLEDVARITKIQPRILDRLEGGTFEGLPADVFVRGFVRSVARCVGLDEDEAVRRYGGCSAVAGPAARAMVEAMADLAPRTASPTLLREPKRAAPDPQLPVQPRERPEARPALPSAGFGRHEA